MKISFCTVSMNRLIHVKNTLLVNMNRLADKDVEFVLLNYNSSDEIDSWVADNLRHYTSNRVLSYYRTDQPAYFHRSHSRNAVFRLASGTIVCNVDADNFISLDFYHFIMQSFEGGRDVVVRCKSQPDSLGRIAFRKSQFLEVRGFDEKMSAYGFEELDFISRLKRQGVEEIFVPELMCSDFITHDDSLRIENEFLWNNIYSIYIRKLNHFKSEVLFLYKNGTCRRFIIIDMWNRYTDVFYASDMKSPTYQYETINRKLDEGRFLMSERFVKFVWGSSTELYEVRQDVLAGSSRRYYLVGNASMITEIIKLCGEVSNRGMMSNNAAKSRKVNLDGFGCGSFKIGLTDSLIKLE